jgi:hypothetical protein
MTIELNGPPPAAVPWDIDALSGDELRATYLDLSRFVAWLRQCDVDVPACWYVHGWVVRRLAALQHWRTATLDAEAPAKATNDWWVALVALQRAWADLRGHHGAHPPRERPWADPVATPAFEDVVSAAVGAGDRTRRGPRTW